MIGYLFALLTSIFFGFLGIYGKILTRHYNPAIIAWANFTLAFPFVLIIALFNGFPDVQWFDFIWATLLSFLVNLFAYHLFFSALSHSPISHSMPFTAFTPLFLIPIGFFILGEIPTLKGVIGIVLMIVGAYGIHLDSKNLLSPFKNLIRDKGTRLMLFVALIWAVSASVEKVAVLNSSAAFYGVIINAMLSLSYLPYVLFRERENFIKISTDYRSFVILILIAGPLVFFQFSAYQYLLASYVIAFKRSGVIVSVLLGHLILKEKSVIKNLFFTIFMVSGALLIMLT
jgi:drug/metabolite transporter (DMT)-like permease